jgi:hypothetical protein
MSRTRSTTPGQAREVFNRLAIDYLNDYATIQHLMPRSKGIALPSNAPRESKYGLPVAVADRVVCPNQADSETFLCDDDADDYDEHVNPAPLTRSKCRVVTMATVFLLCAGALGLGAYYLYLHLIEKRIVEESNFELYYRYASGAVGAVSGWAWNTVGAASAWVWDLFGRFKAEQISLAMGMPDTFVRYILPLVGFVSGLIKLPFRDLAGGGAIIGCVAGSFRDAIPAYVFACQALGWVAGRIVRAVLVFFAFSVVPRGDDQPAGDNERILRDLLARMNLTVQSRLQTNAVAPVTGGTARKSVRFHASSSSTSSTRPAVRDVAPMSFDKPAAHDGGSSGDDAESHMIPDDA